MAKMGDAKNGCFYLKANILMTFFSKKLRISYELFPNSSETCSTTHKKRMTC